MSTRYATTVNAIGIRNGTVKSTNGFFDLRLVTPGGLSAKDSAINSEHLFVAAYAACFDNALIHVARIGFNVTARAALAEANILLQSLVKQRHTK